MDSPVPDWVEDPNRAKDPIVHYIDFNAANVPLPLTNFRIGDWVHYGGAVYKPADPNSFDLATAVQCSGGGLMSTTDKGQCLPYAILQITPNGDYTFLCSGQEIK